MATDYEAVRTGDVSIGRVLARSFGVMGDNPVTVFGLTLLLSGLPALAMGFVQRAAIADLQAAGGGVFSPMTLVTGLVGILLAVLTQGALVRATVAYASGERASIGACLATGLAVLLPLVGLSILFGLGIGIGLVLLIVPGILLYVRWAVAAPVLVAERRGVFASFGRSAALTKGARWKVFGLSLVVLIAIWLVSVVLGLVAFALVGVQGIVAGATPPIALLLLNLVVSTVLTAFWSTVPTALYVELRQAKEGPEDEKLADIFA